MDTTSIEQRLTAAKDAARKAGALLLGGPQDGMQAKAKGKSDFVTVMDLASERLIKDLLHAQFPQDNFLGEETGFEAHGDGGTWVIDPIDGTNNYIYGLPTYTVSIAYEIERHCPVVGVVFVPCLDQLFHASVGMGAFKNGVSISCSSLADASESLLIISPPSRIPGKFAQYLAIYGRLARKTGEIRDFGSAAYHMSLVAAGMAEAFVEFGLQYHDIAAGMVILSEAGGKISPIDPQETGWSGNIVATSTRLHDWYVHQVIAE